MGLMSAKCIPGQAREYVLQGPLPDLADAFRSQFVLGPQLLDVSLKFQQAGDGFDLVPELIALLPHEVLNLLGVDFIQVEAPGSTAEFMLQLLQPFQFLQGRRVRGGHGFLELLFEAPDLLQKIMNPLYSLAIIVGLDTLLFQKVESFADVILPEEHIGELFENVLRIGPLDGWERFFPPIIAITDHDHVPERQKIFMV
jgi:hypothetical protein